MEIFVLTECTLRSSWNALVAHILIHFFLLIKKLKKQFKGGSSGMNLQSYKHGNIVFFYCNACLHLQFARIDACNEISLVYTKNAMARVDVSLITQSNYACTTQDKLWCSTIATKLRSVASKPF